MSLFTFRARARACLLWITYFDDMTIELLYVNIGWRMEMRGTYCDSSRHVRPGSTMGKDLEKVQY